MRQLKSQCVAGVKSATRPGSCSLIVHILRGACMDGMQVPALLGVALTIVLYSERFPYQEAIAALVTGSIILIGLLRGCANWQQELADYQRKLVTQRHQARQDEAGRGTTSPGFIPFNPR